MRNAFEWIWPFQETCAKLFGDKNKLLVLSSEWNLVPFITTVAPYSNIPALSKFAFIGLPASEAKNPLIIPAAAHEVGHSLWQSGGHIENIQSKISSAIAAVKSDLNVAPDVDRVALNAQKQLQEMFCDLIGAGIFGVSYLHTFSYFCPSPGDLVDFKLVRDGDYPANATRAACMLEFLGSVGVSSPPDYLTRYDNPKLSGIYRNEDHIVCVDAVVSTLLGELGSHVRGILEQKGLLRKQRSDEVSKIVRDFRADVPHANPVSIADIVEAGWEVYHDELPISQEKFEDLSNLLLKTIEVYEFNKRARG